jgi:hypothetical protein
MDARAPILVQERNAALDAAGALAAQLAHAQVALDAADAEVARLTALVETMRRLRSLQRLYFKFRGQDTLIEAKMLEKELDAALDAPPDA